MASNDEAAAGDTGTLLSDYLSEKQLAAELGVTLRTLRNWRAFGETPPITRVGIKLYFARTDCEVWLRRQRVEVA